MKKLMPGDMLFTNGTTVFWSYCPWQTWINSPDYTMYRNIPADHCLKEGQIVFVVWLLTEHFPVLLHNSMLFIPADHVELDRLMKITI